MDAGFEIFHIFYAKKRLFFWTPLIFGLEARKKIGISLKFLHQKNVQVAPPPPISVHLKIPSFLKSDATLTTLTNVSYNAQMEAFTTSFYAMMAVFWTVLGLLVSSGALLEAFCGLRSPFWAFWRLFGPKLVAKFPPPGDVGSIWTLFGPGKILRVGKIPPFRVLAIQESSFSGVPDPRDL